jgi:hypothetical protein
MLKMNQSELDTLTQNVSTIFADVNTATIGQTTALSSLGDNPHMRGSLEYINLIKEAATTATSGLNESITALVDIMRKAVDTTMTTEEKFAKAFSALADESFTTSANLDNIERIA